MSRNTLARAYAASTRPVLPAATEALPAVQPAAQPRPPAVPVVRGTSLQRTVPAGPQQPDVIADALLIAVRRSLASCRDSTQLRMLAAFEASR
jgi:hypothetical protein